MTLFALSSRFGVRGHFIALLMAIWCPWMNTVNSEPVSQIRQKQFSGDYLVFWKVDQSEDPDSDVSQTLSLHIVCHSSECVQEWVGASVRCKDGWGVLLSSIVQSDSNLPVRCAYKLFKGEVWQPPQQPLSSIHWRNIQLHCRMCATMSSQLPQQGWSQTGFCDWPRLMPRQF